MDAPPGRASVGPTAFPDDSLPRSNARGDSPGIGGILKDHPEDFEVEEVPAYEPVGEGEHLFLWVERRDMSSEQMVRHAARTLGIPVHDIGVAGIKDRRAVIRQYISVPARCEGAVSRIDNERLTVRRMQRHGNKLRSGHLRGNRFTILVRQVAADARSRAEPIAQRVRRLGFPNYYGSQRFGADASTWATGLALLTGDQAARDLPPSRRRFLLRLSLSAVQSQLFNLVLADRIRDGLLRTVLPGDVMQVVSSGGCFRVDDASREQERFAAGETAITGPMYGPRMLAPAGEPARREAEVLRRQQLSTEMFERYPKLTQGTRRPLLAWSQDLTLEEDSDGLRFRFSLPSGTYATALLREFM